MNRWINWAERALNLYPGDLGRGFPLSACLFLIISANVIGKVARDALFLTQFAAVQLPYADIASGVLVGLVVVIYLRMGRRTSLGSLLVASPLFFGATCVFFWALAHYSRPGWLYAAFYVWVGMLGVLAPTQVWTLANHLLTTREAKRIFGMVAGGGILGWIFGGYLSKTVAKASGAESLLLALAGLLIICSAVVAVVSKGGKLRLDPGKDTTASIAGTGPKYLQQSILSLFSSPYLRAIAAVICLSNCATTVTGWQFKAVAQQFSVGKEALAIFFGSFYSYAGILALLFQLLLTTRLLRRFGIGFMLLVLPVVVLAGSAGLLIWGTVAAALFLRGGDQVLRYSVWQSTTELLYLPLPSRGKLRAKWFIDTVVWRLGDGLAAVVVLIFAAQLGWTPQQISWIAILLILGWLAAAYVAGKQYVVVLQDSISQHRLDIEQVSTPTLGRSTVDVLAKTILASDSGEVLYALSLFEVESQRGVHPVVRGLLNHPAPEVRQKAISILSAAGDKSVRPAVEVLLKDPDDGVRTEAMLYLVHNAHVDPLALLNEIGDFVEFSVRSAVAAYLARPGEAQSIEAARQILTAMSRESGEDGQPTRLELARTLGGIPDAFDPLLATLLRDPDNLVVHEAIRSVGTLRKLTLVPSLLELLPNREFASGAARSLAKFGDQIIGFLGDRLGESSSPIDTRRAIPRILVSIGAPAAARVLADNLLERDTTLRFQIIRALNKIHRLHPDIALDLQLVETVLAAEIMGHYRSYQILETLNTPEDPHEPVVRALHESMQQQIERIFRLLGLLYPHFDVHSVYFGLQSNDATVYDNSLELLENVLKSHQRALLVPLLDGKVSPKERAAIAHRFVHAGVENREQAVAELIGSEDPWLKSCGAYAIGMFGITSLEVELKRCLEDPDPLLRETARAAKLSLEALTPES